MSTSDPTAAEPRSTLRCADCDAPLAHDQRYCVECGARRGPLPAEIAALIGAIHEQGPEPALPSGTPLAESLADVDRRPPAFGFTMPGPRAAAAAVMAMLGFGVIVGSLVGGTSVATLASAPLIVVGMDHPATTPAVQTVAAAQAADPAAAAAAAARPPPAAEPRRRPDGRAGIRLADDVADDDHRHRHDLGWL